MFFNSFASLVEIIIMAVLVYFSVIVILRISGKRTLSDLNAFDFIVTITMGSIGATTILSVDTSFIDGLVAILTLVVLQYIVAKLDAHFNFVSKVIKSDPTLLYYKGHYLHDTMIKMRVTEEDILQEIRNQAGSLKEDIDAVILESNGKLSVIKDAGDKGLDELKGYK